MPFSQGPGTETAAPPEFEVLVLRHGQANAFSAAANELALGPLGLTQAEALSRLECHPRRALASPALRCRQTIAPLAVAHGLEVELDERLGEHTEGDPWDELLAGIATDTVICTHGPQLKRLGGRVPGQIPGSPWLDLPVASGWRLRVIAGVVTEGQRIEPPDLVPTGATERPGIPGSVPNPATKT